MVSLSLGTLRDHVTAVPQKRLLTASLWCLETIHIFFSAYWVSVSQGPVQMPFKIAAEQLGHFGVSVPILPSLRYLNLLSKDCSWNLERREK